MEVLKEAVELYGWPEVFNTDQGCQYTSEKFTGLFEDKACTAKLSMDGKGRSLDNVYIERFWRTIKYEDVYIKGYENVAECKKGVGAFICNYNNVRLHSSLDNVALNRNLDKNRKANKVYISNQGATLWQKKTKTEQRSVAA